MSRAALAAVAAPKTMDRDGYTVLLKESPHNNAFEIGCGRDDQNILKGDCFPDGEMVDVPVDGFGPLFVSGQPRGKSPCRTPRIDIDPRFEHPWFFWFAVNPFCNTEDQGIRA